jgi:dTDP-4-amino-4,6-dideoxygalactose transaminase
MRTVLTIARKYGLFVVEDAAQGFIPHIWANHWINCDIGVLAFKTKNICKEKAGQCCLLNLNILNI